MDKLGIKEMPKVGTKFNIEAACEVVGVNMNAGKESESRSIRLQLTSMCLE